MARPTKDGLDYFPLDTKTEKDIKFQVIEARFGIVGFGIIVKLYQLIYSDKGYYAEWNELISVISAAKWSCTGLPIEPGTVNKVVRAAAKYGIFDEEKLNKYGVLTSAGIQKRYLEVCKRRKNLKLRQEYLLVSAPDLDINVCNNEVNVCNNSDNVCNNEEKGNNGNNGNMERERGNATSRFPTLSEIQAFVSEKKLKINPEKFYYYYQGKKWKGISDWQAKAKEWNASEKPDKVAEVSHASYSLEAYEEFMEKK